MQPPRHLICGFALAVLGLPLAQCESLAATDSQPNRIRIEYVVPKSPEHQPIYERLKENRALEKLQEIFGAFRLPTDLTLRIVGCDGVANAWYERGQITVCYEYLDVIRKNSPQETTKDGISPTDSMVGQFFYVFTHEMGHAMFDLLAVPVFGRAEDCSGSICDVCCFAVRQRPGPPGYLGHRLLLQELHLEHYRDGPAGGVLGCARPATGTLLQFAVPGVRCRF